MPPTQPQPIPTEFFAQLLYRLGHKTPRFFTLIRNVAGVIAVLNIVMGQLPGSVRAQYPVLDVLGNVLIAVAAVTAAVMAQATIETPATPPVG